MATTKTPNRSPRTATRTAARQSAVAATSAAAALEARPSAGEVAAQLAGAVRSVRAAAGVRRPAARAAVSTDLVSELNNIDFRKMIGGPLQAAVDAQVASSLATVDFINKVGFTVDDQGKKELVMVDFTHKRNDGKKADGTDDIKDVAIRVPLLAMLPIPSLRIEHVIIDFNVKLNSVESSSTSTALGVNAELKGGWGPVSLKVSASFQRKTATNVEVKKEYSLNVNVKAVQDEIPAGLEKILGLLAA